MSCSSDRLDVYYIKKLSALGWNDILEYHRICHTDKGVPLFLNVCIVPV